MSDKRARLRRAGAVLACAVVLTATAGAPSAHAYTFERVGSGSYAPNMFFVKNWGAPLNSQLVTFVSVLGTRWRIGMRAGSGNGTTDQCATNRGWLPNGRYGAFDNDDGSHLRIYNKTWGDPVVTGWVWDLGDKRCGQGTKKRTELFIHSQGTGGWHDGNYASAGCIKINQVDRQFLAGQYLASYGRDNGFLDVG